MWSYTEISPRDSECKTLLSCGATMQLREKELALCSRLWQKINIPKQIHKSTADLQNRPIFRRDWRSNLTGCGVVCSTYCTKLCQTTSFTLHTTVCSACLKSILRKYIFLYFVYFLADHTEVKKSKNQLRARDNVRVLICIESLCHRYT